MTGDVDSVDMQILHDLNVVRFLTDVRSIKKIPLTLEYYVKPYIYF